MFTEDEIELGKVALEVAGAEGGYRARALRMLRDECGWTLYQADAVIAYLLVQPPLAKRGA